MSSNGEGVRYALVEEGTGILMARYGPSDVAVLGGQPRQTALIAGIAADLGGTPHRVPLGGEHSIAYIHHAQPMGRDLRQVNRVATAICRGLGAPNVVLRGPVIFTAAPAADGLLRSLADEELTVLAYNARRTDGAKM